MTPKALDIWVYLSTSPLLGLTVTLVVYQGAYWIYRRANFHPLLNPVALSVATLVLLLTLTGTPYQTYFDGAQFVHFLLGPATVALAIPLYAQLGKMKSLLVPLLAALLAGA
ncbi:MAG: LrgB family protein, partial [Burkholderiales bacterium]|nr:LrgB family protein [Burkholderiales bacterium]